jgi:DNA-binding IclR family transcriptional regulator
MPLELGASGRVLLAFSDNEEEGQQEVREKGFALSMGERDEEVAAMAVPILTTSGHLLGALSVSGLITRFTPDKHEPILAALKASQQRLMSQISE